MIGSSVVENWSHVAEDGHRVNSDTAENQIAEVRCVTILELHTYG